MFFLRFLKDIYIYICIFVGREYVVDLVGKPGNVHGPDSSINGSLSSISSPFQISHQKDFQRIYRDGRLCSQIINSKHTRPPPEDPLYPGMLFLAYLDEISSNIL